MNQVINNNNKCKLKFWLSMLYRHERKFMFGPCLLMKGLLKSLFFVNLSIFVCPKAVTNLKNALFYPLVLATIICNNYPEMAVLSDYW